jgi:hypothetical protein
MRNISALTSSALYLTAGGDRTRVIRCEISEASYEMQASCDYPSRQGIKFNWT